MEELTLTTPALLFSAVSLILLAYTNRFLSYAQLVRILRDRYMEDPSDINVAQIENLRKTPQPDPYDAGIRHCQSILLRSHHVSYLHRIVPALNLYLRVGIATADRFFGGFPPRDTDIHPCPGHLPEYDGRQAEALTAHVQDSYHPYTESSVLSPSGSGGTFTNKTNKGKCLSQMPPHCRIYDYSKTMLNV